MEASHLHQLVSKNQSIKIVPSVEDSLRSMGLFVNYDENAELWLQQLKLKWKSWKKSSTVENHIEMFLQSVPDPFRIALAFIVKCEDFKDCKPKSLPYFIIETLLKWSQSNGVEPDESLKAPAFQIAIQQRNQNFLCLVVKTYKLSTIKQNILPLVRDMISNDNCRQASQIVMAMELFEDIPVEDLMFPLILQDKNNLIDEYLCECQSQVKPLLSFLDRMLDKSFNLKEYVQDYIEKNKICGVKYDKIHYKPMGKLVARLCNKFNIPIETCKNLSKNRTTGGLRYLIYQKYQVNNVSSSVWDDLVKDSLKQNAESAQEFIDMLIDYDKNEALKWAEYLKLPETKLPLALKELSLNEISVHEENWDKDESSPQDYYQLTLPSDKIIMITSGELFYDLIIGTLVNCNVVSIDCEWKPSFGATQSHVALIQIATFDNVYLIDTLILNHQKYSSLWYTFYKKFLDNAEIIKLGFGMEQDLREIKLSIIGLSHIKVKGEGLLDLCELWKSLLNHNLVLPSSSDNGGNSLSCLVQSCFGFPLEKAEQCSNWELRPLRDTQIRYAATDAYVLIQIYDFLQKLCYQQKINFEEICNDVMLEKKKKCPKKIKVIDRIQSSLAEMEPKAANSVKVLVEPTLSTLMCYLSYCGIDTAVMPVSMQWHDVINLAISENRIILSAKMKITPTANFPQSSIIDVGKASVTEQLQRIFTKLNISIKQSDLLSLCIYCNSKDLKILEPEEVQNICKEYQAASTSSKQTYEYDNYDDDDDPGYDNFLSDSDGEDLYYMQHDNQSKTNKSCLTSKGIPVQISNVPKLSTLNEKCILCEACGQLLWKGEELLKAVIDTVFNITNLKI